jgi:hypothetical protein
MCLEKLLDIMKENNYPKKVLVSDATEIILKREYHPRYNFILGEAYQ